MRKLILLLIIFPSFLMASEYPDSFEPVSKKFDQFGFASLNEKEEVIYLIWWLETEVNNGGFYQYFWNSAGNHSDATFKCLTKIGAIKTASLLKQAVDVAFDGNAPVSLDSRRELLEIDGESKEHKLSELDSEFYEYSEDFYKMIDVYASS